MGGRAMAEARTGNLSKLRYLHRHASTHPKSSSRRIRTRKECHPDFPFMVCVCEPSMRPEHVCFCAWVGGFIHFLFSGERKLWTFSQFSVELGVPTCDVRLFSPLERAHVVLHAAGILFPRDQCCLLDCGIPQNPLNNPFALFACFKALRRRSNSR